MLTLGHKHRDGREGQVGLQIENKVLIRLELKG